MLLLASTSDLLRVTTSAAVTVDVHASYVDRSGVIATPGRTNTPITTATTTTVVGSPASSTTRTVKTLTIRNRHASSSVDVTVILSDGTLAMELLLVTLSAGDALHYDEHRGFTVRDSKGRIKTRTDNSLGMSIGSLTTVVLASDVVNQDASANTMADVTGLSFAVTSGQVYWFRFVIAYDSANTTTGSRWAINGPASPTWLGYRQTYTITALAATQGYQSTYDAPAGANASSLLTGNTAVVEGIIKPSANGTVIGRFASEVSASAITAKAGSILDYQRTL